MLLIDIKDIAKQLPFIADGENSIGEALTATLDKSGKMQLQIFAVQGKTVLLAITRRGALAG